MTIANLVLDGTFLAVLAINVLLAYSAYYGLWSGGFVLVFAGFAGIGGYTLAVAATRGQMAPTVGVLLAVVIAAALAVVVTVPLRRVDGMYLGIVSIGFVVLCQSVESNWESVTNGASGIAVPFELSVPTVALVAAAIAVALATWLVDRSTLGLLLKAKRVDSLLATSLGVNTRGLWFWLFVSSAVLASVAGALRVGWLGFVGPTDFSFALMVTVIAMVILGGNDHWAGPGIGAAVLTVLNELLQGAGEWASVINGFVLLLVVLIAPEGIAGNVRRTRMRRRARSHRVSVHSEAPAVDSRPSTESPGTGPRADRSGAVLTVNHVKWQVGNLKITDDVSLALVSGEICGLVGPNGSGKSSLLNLISGATVPDSGSVLIGETDLIGRPAHEFVRQGISRTFQSVRVMERETALDNVRISAWRGVANESASAQRGLRRGTGRHSPGKARHEALWALDRVGAKEFAMWLAGDVSFGTRRKIELARAVLPRPSVLLLDEPTSGVSGEHIELMKELIRSEADRGCAVLIVDHDLEVISEICDRVIVIDAGTKIFDGGVSEAFLDPKVQEAYVGA